MAEPMSFTFEDARIIYLNFAGNEKQYNRAGERNFCVVIPPEMVEVMVNDGWAIKHSRPRDDDEDGETFAFLKVKVNFGTRPPKVVVVSNNGETLTQLKEDQVEVIDSLDIKTVDLKCVASMWEVGGKTGIAAYLKSIYVVINEDDLDRKYAPKETH